MNDLARVHETENELLAEAEGRHAIDEDALLTPIFAALRRGKRRHRTEYSRTGEAAGKWGRDAGGRDEYAPAREALRDPVDEFRRDPLTAPIPVQALVPAPSRSTERTNIAAHRYGEERADGGRHHRERVGSSH